MMQLLILLDYRSHFYSSTRARGDTMDVEAVKAGFEQLGYSVLVQHYSDLNFCNSNWTDTLVLYQSSEDPSLLYKDYIEDVLLGLQTQGAILIPRFEKFRAHHNKVFMEILRKTIPVSGADFSLKVSVRMRITRDHSARRRIRSYLSQATDQRV